MIVHYGRHGNLRFRRSVYLKVATESQFLRHGRVIVDVLLEPLASYTNFSRISFLHHIFV